MTPILFTNDMIDDDALIAMGFIVVTAFILIGGSGLCEKLWSMKK